MGCIGGRRCPLSFLRTRGRAVFSEWILEHGANVTRV